MIKSKRSKKIKEKQKRMATAIFAVAIVAVIIIGILQSAGIINLFSTLVLDSEHEGAGRIGIYSSSSFEAQSIVIVQVDTVKKIELKLSRDDSLAGLLMVGVYTELTGGDALYAKAEPIIHINSGKYNPGWLDLSANFDVSPGDKIYLVFRLIPSGEGNVYFWSSARTTDSYTSGKEFYKGPSTSGQWVANYNPDTGYPFVDHSFRIWGETTNQHPSAPATPTGPSSGNPNVHYTFVTTGSTDPEGQEIEYKWDFDDGSATSWYLPTYIHSFDAAGTYDVKVKARDELGAESGWSSSITIVISQEAQNHAPSTPAYSSWETELEIDEIGTWIVSSTDPDGDNLYYIWTVDGSTVRQSGFLPSGTSDTMSHTFSSSGSHIISVRAREFLGLYSDWSTKTVAVSTSSQQQPVTISVMDSTTYLAISGATVICNGETKTTDSSGVVTYTLGAGSYTATVSASGYSPGSVSFVVSSSPISRTVMLDPGAGETGEIVTISVADGQTYSGISGATVICNGETKTTDSNGVVTYTLPDGTYTAVSTKTGYQSNSISFSLPGSTSHSMYLSVGSGDPTDPPVEGEYSVLVEVYDDSTNEPIQGATVTIDNLDKLTNQFGTASFNLQGGGITYSVSVTMLGYYGDVKYTTVDDSPKSVVFYLISAPGGDDEEPTPPLPPVPGIPGFELFSLIAAIGIAFYLRRRKRNG